MFLPLRGYAKDRVLGPQQYSIASDIFFLKQLTLAAQDLCLALL